LTTNQTISVFIATWNLQGKCPTGDISKLLPLEEAYDIYCVGTEECEQSVEVHLLSESASNVAVESVGRAVEREVGSRIARCRGGCPTSAICFFGIVDSSGDSHCHFCEEVSLRSHFLSAARPKFGLVFDESIPQGIQRSCVATGLGNIVGNKGAAALSFCIDGTSMLFISSHFEGLLRLGLAGYLGESAQHTKSGSTTGTKTTSVSSLPFPCATARTRALPSPRIL